MSCCAHRWLRAWVVGAGGGRERGGTRQEGAPVQPRAPQLAARARVTGVDASLVARCQVALM